MVEGDRVVGAVTQIGLQFRARAVVLTAGTFLDGKIHVGLQNYSAGRAGDPPAISLSAPPERTEAAAGPPENRHAAAHRRPQHRLFRDDANSRATSIRCPVFSYMGNAAMHPQQVPCWVTHTNAQTHDIIRNGLDRSPMYTGVIEGVGPRYCPSIEDKIHRFASQGIAPDLPRAGRPDHQRVLSERDLDQPAVRRAAGAGALDARPGKRLHPASRLCDRIRLFRPARPESVAGNQGDRRPVLCRPDQRHHRLRRSGGAGHAGRYQCRAADPGQGRLDAGPLGSLPGRAGRRPDDPGRGRALPHVHQPRRIPPDRCAKTMPTCA